MAGKQKIPKGLSKNETLENLFDNGFERIKLRPLASSRGRERNTRVPYSLRMGVVRENRKFMLQTLVYSRDRGNCRYIGKLTYTICGENDIHE